MPLGRGRGRRSGGGLVGVDGGGDEGGRASCFLCVGIMIQEDGGSGRGRG